MPDKPINGVSAETYRVELHDGATSEIAAKTYHILERAAWFNLDTIDKGDGSGD